MKEGTGGDSFADDDLLTDDGPSTDEDDATTNLRNSDDTTSQEKDQVGFQTQDEETDDGDGLPWAVLRNSVKSDREMVQFYLREFVQERESEFQRAVETETGYGIYLTDVREAAYLVAMNHPEEVINLLNEWGCEYV